MKSIFMLLLFLLAFPILAYPEPPQIFFIKVSHYLKTNIPEATWLDINSTDESQFNIRFYPCTEKILLQLENILPRAIQNNSENCLLAQLGQNEQIEGYCRLRNNKIKCTL